MQNPQDFIIQLKKIFAIASIICAPNLVFAQYGIEIEPYGFVTAVAGKSDSKITSDLTNDKVNYTDHSIVGVGLLARIDSQLSARILAIADGSQEQSFEIDLFHLNWDAYDSLQLRFGQIRLPLWLTSEYVFVGALQSHIRPPHEVYGLSPVDAYVGGSLIWRAYNSENLNLEVEVYGGGVSGDVTVGNNRLDGDLRDILGSQIILSGDTWMARLAYVQMNIDIDVFSKNLTPIANSSSSISDDIQTPVFVENTQFLSAGLKWDHRDFLLQSELAYAQSDSSTFQVYRAYYATFGYYFFNKKILPHYTFSNLDEADTFLVTGAQESHGLGVNWSINDSVAAKFDWTQTRVKDGSAFFESDPGRVVNFYFTSLNFVF